ncbi:MAG: alpha/beta hydrolase, partial [Planctomycetota bacterium]
PNFDKEFKFGLKNTSLSKEDLKKSFSKKLLILLGENDTDENHKHLNKDPGSMEQGRHRLERGKYFYKKAKEEARHLKIKLKWDIRTVPGVSHSNHGMARALIELLKKSKR